MLALSMPLQTDVFPTPRSLWWLVTRRMRLDWNAQDERGIKTLSSNVKDVRVKNTIARLSLLLKEHQVDFVCLAGYMRCSRRYFIEAFRNRILNIHPSLLPAFPGLDAQRQAIEHGVKWTGCTVHFVDETLDGGPIIAQKIVRCLTTTRKKPCPRAYSNRNTSFTPRRVALVVSGKYEIVGRRVLPKCSQRQLCRPFPIYDLRFTIYDESMNVDEQLSILRKGTTEIIRGRRACARNWKDRRRPASRFASNSAWIRQRPDIHLGHTVVIRKLRAFQELGPHRHFSDRRFHGTDR